MLLTAHTKFSRCFFLGIFLIVPGLHRNAAAPKPGFCKFLIEEALVGASGFEPEASCAQVGRAASWKSFLFNVSFENK